MSTAIALPILTVQAALRNIWRLSVDSGLLSRGCFIVPDRILLTGCLQVSGQSLYSPQERHKYKAWNMHLGAWKWFHYFWFYLKPQWFPLAELLPGVNRSKMELHTLEFEFSWSREWQKWEHKWKNDLNTWCSGCGDGRSMSQSAVRPAFMLFYPSPLLQGKQANTKLTGCSLEGCLHTKWWQVSALISEGFLFRSHPSLTIPESTFKATPPWGVLSSPHLTSTERRITEGSLRL